MPTTLGGFNERSTCGCGGPLVSAKEPAAEIPIPSTCSSAGGTVSALEPVCETWTTASALIAATRVPLSLRGVESTTYRNVYVMNFVVAAFQHALADTGPGELGARFAGRPFNGIVWSSSTWPDKDLTMTPTLPHDVDPDRESTLEMPVLQWGTGGDTKPRFPRVVRAPPPQPLCLVGTSTAGDDAGFDSKKTHQLAPCTLVGADGDPVYAATHTTRIGRHTIEAEAARATGQAAIGAVRVINARNINRTPPGTVPVVPEGMLPNGLTIVTDLALIIQGDVNLSSEPALNAAAAYDAEERDEASGRRSWVPVLLGGDTVRVFGNGAVDGDQKAWEDTGLATPLPVTLHTAVLAGLAGQPPNDLRCGVDLSGAIFPGELGAGLMFGVAGELTVIGSIAVMHRPVYGPIPPWCDGDCPDDFTTAHYQPNRVSLIFDHRFASLDRQPPGAVTLSVAATRAWER